ncbi:hypothetical protein [Parasphingorhabdus sp.]|uniref:hypothetical protein n=1 Tax=Parasphingorhabdus sp. TaxID=2709688 RepID=UPI003263E0A5
MTATNKLSRTDVSAIISVLLFGVTILISSVGPAQAEDTATSNETSSPAVSFVTIGYRA